MKSVEILKVRALEAMKSGLRSAIRLIDGMEKAEIAEEMRRFRALRDPNATPLQICRFARNHPGEMSVIASTPIDDYGKVDTSWTLGIGREPSSTLVNRIERKFIMPRINARLAALRRT